MSIEQTSNLLGNLSVGEKQIAETLPQASIATIANIIRRDWRNVYFGAVPYLNAMRSMDKISDDFGLDSGRSVVTYFLGNAQTWRGPIARVVKAELNKRVKAK